MVRVYGISVLCTSFLLSWTVCSDGHLGCLAFHPVGGGPTGLPIARRPRRALTTPSLEWPRTTAVVERVPSQGGGGVGGKSRITSLEGAMQRRGDDYSETAGTLLRTAAETEETRRYGDGGGDLVSSPSALTREADRRMTATVGGEEEPPPSSYHTPEDVEGVIVNGLPNNEADDADAADRVANRRRFMGSALLATGAAIGTVGGGGVNGNAIGTAAAMAAAAAADDFGTSSFSTVLLGSTLQWEKSPINKRSGVTLTDAEKSGFNVRFVTYLSRFLLCFDEDCQRWWATRASDIPRTATADRVGALRLRQFAAFSASVEVGLLEYGGPDGSKRLMASLLKRYCPTATAEDLKRVRGGGVKGDAPPLTAAAEAKRQREIREARRQIALLFGLMQTYQPVEEITTLLAAIDNATVTSATVSDPGSGYAPGYGSPYVTFPPPLAGEGYETATGRAILRPSGCLLRIDLVNRGLGYVKPPSVTISAPSSSSGANFTSSNGTISAVTAAATAKAFIFREGPNKGRLERIQLVSPGKGYAEGETVNIEIAPPAAEGGVQATAKAVMELEVGAIEIVSGGSGYATERPLQVSVEPPPLTARVDMRDPVQAGLASPDRPLPPTTVPSSAMLAEMTSSDDPSSRRSRALRDAANSGKGGAGGCIGRACYDRSVVATAYARAAINSFSSEGDAGILQKADVAMERRRGASSSSSSVKKAKQVSGTSSGEESGLPSLPFWGGGSSSSSQLLSLLPSGVGLVYETRLKRYTLARGQDVLEYKPGSSTKPLDPEFGPRGRSPIERDKQLDGPTFLRFCLSGSICSSGAHLLLTPIDVVKTKVQTDPQQYPDVFTALKKMSSEEGAGAFFTGWVPTFLGFFVNGSIGYSTTEFFRRYFTEQVGPSALSLEVPIILASASISGFAGSFTLAPSEAVRIRSVAQPDYADNIVGVFNRMVKEEGAMSLFSAVPAFIPKEILFACAKFTVFDLSTEYMYETFPAAREDLSLSLLVSLAGGTLGGVAAALVSNPADATISEMKKAKSDVGPFGAFNALLERGGIPLLFRGLGLRMFFYSLIVSIQFLVYDAVRYSLRIGSDDLKLYLDVLGGALSDTGGPA